MAEAVPSPSELPLFNTHTGEFETIKYMQESEKIDHFLRCHFTGEKTHISQELLSVISNVQEHFRAEQINVISAYRSPVYNKALRKRGRRVARESLHMQGLAMDIRIPGVPLKKLRDYVRSLEAGGVGYYPRRFVHVDVGPVRHW